MANVIRNMNFKPIVEKLDYKRLDDPQAGASINMRVWDEMKVERLRPDAVKVSLQRNVEPEPACIFQISMAISVEVLVNTSEYDDLADPVAFFKESAVSRVLASHIASTLSVVTTHSQIGPMITAPVAQFPQ